jgi:hypothetical protein
VNCIIHREDHTEDAPVASRQHEQP